MNIEKKLIGLLKDMDSNTKGFFLEDYEEQVERGQNYITKDYIEILINSIEEMIQETAEENISLYEELRVDLINLMEG